MGVQYVRLESTCGCGKSRNGQQITFAADAKPVERCIGCKQFRIGTAAAGNAMSNELVARSASQQSKQERFCTSKF
jgi:hypothetical protein